MGKGLGGEGHHYFSGGVRKDRERGEGEGRAIIISVET